MLLHEFDRDGSALTAVEIEQFLRRAFENDLRQLFRQIGRILDAAVEAHAADRIVDVGGVAGQQHAAFAERLSDALVRHVKIAMHDVVGARRREKRLNARLHAGVAHDVGFRLLGAGGEHRAPQAGRTVGGHLEAVAPGAGVGEIAAVTKPPLGLEIIRRRQDNKALGPGEAFEWNFALLAHDAAAAVGANEIAAGMRLNTVRPARLGHDRTFGLLYPDNLVAEKHLDIQELAEPTEDQLGGLELFALHHIRISRVVLEQRVIELRDQFAARPVPELEDRRNQTGSRHVLREPIDGE